MKMSVSFCNILELLLQLAKRKRCGQEMKRYISRQVNEKATTGGALHQIGSVLCYFRNWIWLW